MIQEKLNLFSIAADDNVANAVTTKLLAERDMQVEMQWVGKLGQSFYIVRMSKRLRPMIQARVTGKPVPRRVEFR